MNKYFIYLLVMVLSGMSCIPDTFGNVLGSTIINVATNVKKKSGNNSMINYGIKLLGSKIKDSNIINISDNLTLKNKNFSNTSSGIILENSTVTNHSTIANQISGKLDGKSNSNILTGIYLKNAHIRRSDLLTNVKVNITGHSNKDITIGSIQGTGIINNLKATIDINPHLKIPSGNKNLNMGNIIFNNNSRNSRPVSLSLRTANRREKDYGVGNIYVNSKHIKDVSVKWGENISTDSRMARIINFANTARSQNGVMGNGRKYVHLKLNDDEIRKYCSGRFSRINNSSRSTGSDKNYNVFIKGDGFHSARVVIGK